MYIMVETHLTDRHELESRQGTGDDVDGCTSAATTAVGSVDRQAGATGRPWRKGQSGNPAGRPPQPGRSGAPGDRLIGADEPTRSMILIEAYRFVTVEEDGRTCSMPLNQAVMRAMGRAALNGNRLAQQRWTRIVREAEREQRAAQRLIYNAMERNDSRRDPKARYTDDVVFDTSEGGLLVRGADEPEAV